MPGGSLLHKRELCALLKSINHVHSSQTGSCRNLQYSGSAVIVTKSKHNLCMMGSSFTFCRRIECRLCEVVHCDHSVTSSTNIWIAGARYRLSPLPTNTEDMPSAWTLLHAATVAATAFSAAAQGTNATAEADYIIIGGGTAGCVLASKLCQGLPDSKIVLLERAEPRSAEAVCYLPHCCARTGCNV